MSLKFWKRKKKKEVVLLSINIRDMLLDIANELYNDSEDFKKVIEQHDFAYIEGFLGAIKFIKVADE